MYIPSKNLLLLALICCGSRQAMSQQMTTEQYIAAYKDIAEEEMLRTGVPAAVSLAQGILESDSGNGWLVQHSNNHFGIKCKDTWTGATVSHDDDRKQECFRKYDDALASWRDHSDFLRSSMRYAGLFSLAPTDYKAWATGLKTAGYATSSTYAQRLVETIERYNLEQYTDEVIKHGNQVQEQRFAEMLNRKVEVDEQEQHIVKEEPVEKAASLPVAHAAYPEGVFKINGSRVVFLKKGASLVAAAEEYHVKLRRLVSYNELNNDEALSTDMLIFLQKKRKQGAHASHKVKAGEDMHAIAQAEGIQLKWLYKRNHLSDGSEPAIGAQLALQGYADEAGKGLADRQDHRNFFQRLFGKKPPQAAPQTVQAQQPSSQPQPQSRPPVAVQKVAEEAAPQASSAKNVSPAGSQKEQGATQVVWEVSHVATSAPSADDHAGAAAAKEGNTYHTIQPKETLYGISRQYGVSVDQLRTWNHLSGDHIQAGQQLIVKIN